MAFNKRAPKKPIYVSAEEREKNRKIVEFTKTFKRTVKMQTVFKKDGSRTDYVETGWFEDMKAYEKIAQSMLQALNEISDKPWHILSKTQLNESSTDNDQLEDDLN